MEILAWNCRDINNDAAVQALRLVIQQKKPSIIFLCETKVHDKNYMQNLRLELGLLNCEAVFSVGQSGGLALFWVDGLDVRFRSKSLNHIDVEIRENDVYWRLTGFYGNLVTAERHRSWSLLRRLGDESSLPWVVIGDLNEILHADEKEGGAVRREGQMQSFRDCLSYCDLHDVGHVGAPFTWKGAGIRSRLDRAVASPCWYDLFPAARLLHLEPIHDDHIPLLLGAFHSSPTLIQRRRHRFRFESYWVKHEECAAVVQEGWSAAYPGSHMFQASKKIMSTRFELHKWQRPTFGNRSREIARIRSRLQQLCSLPLTTEFQEENITLSARLEKLLSEEHDY